MSIGTVTWYSPAKGFGFILPEEGGPQVFVHRGAVHHGGHACLEVNTRVAFDIAQDAKGLQAVRVTRI